MSSSYIPAKDSQYQVWLLNFSTLITASPGTYGLLAADATTIAAAYTAWNTAYLAATNGTTRGPTTIQAKNVQRINSQATARPYSQQIANNAGVSSANKVALGINPRTNPPSPVPAPTTNPVLTISSAIAFGHIVRFRDSLASPSVKAKPAGAIGLQLFASTSATPITDPTLLEFNSVQTKSPFTITWGSGDVGKTAYYAARWVTRRGLVGPWSAIAPFTVAA